MVRRWPRRRPYVRPFRPAPALRGEPAHGLIGSDMGAHLAQGGDGALELRHCRRIPLRDDKIDLIRRGRPPRGEADQVFRRRQCV